MENLKAIVLAAGKGKRMHSEDSDLPKVMREALGRPLLGYVLEALPVENPQDAIIVVGYKREKVIEAYPERTFAVQAEQKGTGHAVASAREALEGFSGDVLVCCGDTPLITRETLEGLCRAHRESGSDCTVLAGAAKEPMPGLGRVKRTEKGEFIAIVEERDCTPEEREIREFNSGIYVFNSEKLFSALKLLKTDNAQGEYYLTDVPYIMRERGDRVSVSVQDMGPELIGVNRPEELSEVERILKERI